MGTGSFGEVRKARSLISGQLRAIKIIYKREYNDSEQIRLLNEIKIAAQLDHPNIIKIYEFFEDRNYIYIVMELCSGGDLYNKIK